MTATRIRLQADGPEVSRIVAGMAGLKEWNLSTDDLRAWIECCIEMGITTFDHADIYGKYTNEERFGQALKADKSLRERIEIVTKCGIQSIADNRPDTLIKHYDTTYDHILNTVERSLKNFHTKYIDLLLIHRPDPLMNADEIASAFIHLKDSGKVRFFGVSNFRPHQFDLIQSRIRFPLVTNQIEFSVLHTDPLYSGELDQCQQRRISPMLWSPFGGGRLFNGEHPELVQTLQALADELGATGIDQIALAWLLRHPANIVPVLGTRNLDRIQSAVSAEKIKLTRQQWFTILRAATGKDVR